MALRTRPDEKPAGRHASPPHERGRGAHRKARVPLHHRIAVRLHLRSDHAGHETAAEPGFPEAAAVTEPPWRRLNFSVPTAAFRSQTIPGGMPIPPRICADVPAPEPIGPYPYAT